MSVLPLWFESPDESSLPTISPEFQRKVDAVWKNLVAEGVISIKAKQPTSVEKSLLDFGNFFGPDDVVDVNALVESELARNMSDRIIKEWIKVDKTNQARMDAFAIQKWEDERRVQREKDEAAFIAAQKRDAEFDEFLTTIHDENLRAILDLHGRIEADDEYEVPSCMSCWLSYSERVPHPCETVTLVAKLAGWVDGEEN